MNYLTHIRTGFLLLLISCVHLTPSQDGFAEEPQWKAGSASVVITPEEDLWMAGYGGRKAPADGKIHDLWLKVLVIEARDGHRGVVVSTDTLGIPQSIYNNVCAALKEKFNLERSQIMLNSSHTHCGPVLRGALHDVYPLTPEHIKQINSYSDKLEQKLVDAVGTALKNLEPATLWTGEGFTSFAVNRRNNMEPDVPKLRKADELKGPSDHSVPVLAVKDKTGKLKTIVFGYACHNTTLGIQQWCGDYAGFAQYDLEAMFPGATAMFYMGCGADQNPLPRRTQELAESYGSRLAHAVADTVRLPMVELDPELKTEIEIVDIKLGDAPTKAELEKIAAGNPDSYITRWGTRLLKQLNAGKPFITAYPFPVQTWFLGNRQIWITIGGEVVVDYALGMKKEFGPSTWVAGYCNDVMAYTPSLRVLEEDVPPRKSSRWGYEGNTSMVVYGMPAQRWSDEVEEKIVESAKRQVKKVRNGK
ncbi:neutral/alkaline non-lysosomal ceramidase N-terminal domain-containing protein [uncultured Gimesia sp.]|jgi:neutral ceramidase|uniref:neutral/alkaline non-lysosomal ceramidase N-terminal domain-containing protein n=1 Tax=uncultured Gimesia sp. TaxID=1678688 RepID=UPI00260C1695|nr:neutral/alkaline non-lysosomal ceramidase N-terminal domain-containing protein [uncultured Gimesia sp.]